VITAKVKGMSQLKAKLAAMQREVKSALKEASLAGAWPMHDEAELVAPRSKGYKKAGAQQRDTRGRFATGKSVGHLADHIEIEVAKSTASTCLVRIGPDKDHWYGRFPETGTVKMAAHPYLRPALDTKQNEALREFAAVMKRRLT